MATVENFIVEAVEDMLVDHCLAVGLDPEASVLLSFRAAIGKGMVLRFAKNMPIPEGITSLSDILGEKLPYIEKGCFDRVGVEESALVAAAERAIVLIFLTIVKSQIPQEPFSLN